MPPVAGLTLNANGSYSFDAGNAAYQHLAEGATTEVVASYTVTDAHGATDTATLTITVTGTNDAPVAVADTDAGHRRQHHHRLGRRQRQRCRRWRRR